MPRKLYNDFCISHATHKPCRRNYGIKTNSRIQSFSKICTYKTRAAQWRLDYDFVYLKFMYTFPLYNFSVEISGYYLWDSFFFLFEEVILIIPICRALELR